VQPASREVTQSKRALADITNHAGDPRISSISSAKLSTHRTSQEEPPKYGLETLHPPYLQEDSRHNGTQIVLLKEIKYLEEQVRGLRLINEELREENYGLTQQLVHTLPGMEKDLFVL
jgi:hypothetical protein